MQTVIIHTNILYIILLDVHITPIYQLPTEKLRMIPAFDDRANLQQNKLNFNLIIELY